MTIQASDYDSYADEVARYTAAREARGVAGDGLLRELLELLGDVSGLLVLDAACGDGYLTRVLADRGARVMGIDIGPRLIERASRRDPDGSIDYRVADLSTGLPGEHASFDAVVSFLALNDVIEYRGFIATIASVLRPGGRLVVAFNSPYGSVVRGNVRLLQHWRDQSVSGAVGGGYQDLSSAQDAGGLPRRLHRCGPPSHQAGRLARPLLRSATRINPA
ncbi:MAG: class I SAM-dependent methyltransferase [Streptosporangiaceae bacterium]